MNWLTRQAPLGNAPFEFHGFNRRNESDTVNEIIKTNRALIACPNSIAQKAALEALTGPQECVEEMRKEYEKRKDYAVKKFKEIGLNFIAPKGTFYIFPEIKQDPLRFSLGLDLDRDSSINF